jgi:hypothetical protein
MKSEVDKLTEAPGILAAAKTEDGTTQLKVSDGGDARRWVSLLDASRQVLGASGSDEVKITFDKYSVVVMRSGNLVLGVVVVKSHPVVKSLKRMLRRAFKRLGSEVPKPQPPAADPTPTPLPNDPTSKLPL